MELSDLNKLHQDKTQCDALYENTGCGTSSAKPANDLQTNCEDYEELRVDTLQNDGEKVKESIKREIIQWKDLPKQIKYIIFTLSVMLVILYIIVLTAVIVIALPKGDDAAWSDWGDWGSCSESCGGGVKSRLRTCTNPRTLFGKGCEGSSEQVELCNKNTCDADGLWTHWSPWSNCDVTCNNGTQTRTRLCTNPSKSNGQPDCFGDSSDTRKCQKDSCDDGVWSNWESWGSCSDSCGGGIKSRFRTCKNVGPSTHGKECKGSSEQVMLCNKNTCDDHKVAFLARGSSTETTYTTIKFPRILLNSGNGYNSSTGRFTCKISGIYNFAVTLTKQRRDIDSIHAYLRINVSRKLWLYSDPSDTGDIDYGSYSLSVTGNFHLNTNDYVDVLSAPNNFINDYRTSFTGVLVIPDN